MHKVTVVEDETMVGRGTILTIDWAALDCVITGGVANGEEGAGPTIRLSPDIIVADVKMPRMDGMEMITKLRKQGRHVKFIIPTAYSDLKHAQGALRLGVSDYLLKPLRDGDLGHAVGYVREQMGERPPKEEETGVVPVLRFHSDKKSRNKYMEAVTRCIREHYRGDITISTVASLLGISEGCLSRVLKKEVDYVSVNYLAYYRIQVAMNPPKDCRVKAYEVADQVEYSDIAYFSAQFKKILGVPSSEYQGRCRQLQQFGQAIIDRESRKKCSTIY